MSQSQTSQQWWYVDGGETKGPVPSDAIRDLVAAGTLDSSSRIIPVGAQEWSTVAQEEGALGMTPAAAPASPPPPPPQAAAQAQWGAPASAAPASPAAALPTSMPAAPAAEAAAPANLGGAPLASNGKRFGSYLLDGLLAVVTLFIGWLIWSVIIWEKGETPAKALLGLRCVDTTTGRPATRGTMALRELVYKGILGSVTGGITTIVSAFMILLTDSREGIWDKIAKTAVVEDPGDRLLA
jgi:uncharacterized RDD family membrane protein YckC